MPETTPSRFAWPAGVLAAAAVLVHLAAALLLAAQGRLLGPDQFRMNPLAVGAVLLLLVVGGLALAAGALALGGGWRVPLAACMAVPALLVLVATAATQPGRIKVRSALAAASPEIAGAISAIGAAELLIALALALLLAGFMLGGVAAALAVHAFARARGGRSLPLAIAAVVLGGAVFGLVGGLSARTTLAHGAFAVPAVLAALVAASVALACAARGEAERRVETAGALLGVAFVGAMALLSVAGAVMLSGTGKTLSALGAASPELKTAILAVGLGEARQSLADERRFALLPLVAALPALALAARSLPELLRVRLAHGLGAAVLAAALAAPGVLADSLLEEAAAAMEKSAVPVDLGGATVALPVADMGAEVPAGVPLVVVGTDFVKIDGKKAGPVAQLDTATGAAELAGRARTLLPRAPRPTNGWDDSDDGEGAGAEQGALQVVVAADRATRGARLLRLLEALAGGERLEVSLVHDVELDSFAAGAGAPPPPFDRVPPPRGVVRAGFGPSPEEAAHLAGGAGDAVVVVTATGARLEFESMQALGERLREELESIDEELVRYVPGPDEPLDVVLRRLAALSRGGGGGSRRAWLSASMPVAAATRAGAAE